MKTIFQTYVPPKVARRDTVHYPSANTNRYNTTKADKPRHSHTVAIAYNKGPYQVISKECVKDIGR